MAVNDDPALVSSKKIARELFDACNAFKEDSKQWQRIAVAIQAAEEEIERLTRERDQLLTAIGEHVTVRSDQYALIQQMLARGRQASGEPT